MGERLWPLDTTLRVHLVAAPIVAFLLAAGHRELAPQFNPHLRAAAMTIIWTVAEGGAPLGTAMPPIKDVLPKDDSWSVIAYIQARLPVVVR